MLRAEEAMMHLICIILATPLPRMANVPSLVHHLGRLHQIGYGPAKSITMKAYNLHDRLQFIITHNTVCYFLARVRQKIIIDLCMEKA